METALVDPLDLYYSFNLYLKVLNPSTFSTALRLEDLITAAAGTRPAIFNACYFCRIM